MQALVFSVLSEHVRHLIWPTVAAYVVLLVLGALWCFACTCCLVPRRLRTLIGFFCCVALFVALALTVYVVTTVSVEMDGFGF